MTLTKLALALALTSVTAATYAEVSPQEADRLQSDLTPVGAQKAGNQNGTIPAWTGGMVDPKVVYEGRRPDPFADEKPLFSITAKNVGEYSDKLSDGVKALLDKYPTYRIDVYKTHRTAAFPQYVYDNTFKNATVATVATGASGVYAQGAYGGFPFPVPQTGEQVVLNSLVRWRGESWVKEARNYQVTADGKPVLLSDIVQYNTAPYYFKENTTPSVGTTSYWNTRVDTKGPAIRAGEAIIGKQTVDEANSNSWVYLVGQRRVRKLPYACCDTPTPALAGVASFDEFEVRAGQLDRFDWKLVGKKELYIPYNSNRTLTATQDSQLLGPKHINPDYMRWELHRVWVVEATLKPGKRHVVAKSTYYFDEDTWIPVMADRSDAKGQLWRVLYPTPTVLPDLPGVVPNGFTIYDLQAGTYLAAEVAAESKQHYRIASPRVRDSYFAPESMAGTGVR